MGVMTREEAAADLGPIVEHYELEADPRTAFTAYVERIGEWWDPRYTTNRNTFETIVFEQHVGGAVTEVHSTGVTHDWGTVTAWEPGRRVAYTSRLGQHGGDATIITVRFQPGRGGGTTVRFEHGGWNATNLHDRAKFAEWRAILDRYASLLRGR